MEKKIKTENVHQLYNITKTASYNKLDDGDKVKFFKIVRVIKEVSEKFDDIYKDALDKFKPTDDTFNKQFENAQKYEQYIRLPFVKESDLPITTSEYIRFIDKIMSTYNKLVKDATKEDSDKEVTLTFDGLSEEAFGKLMASNEWTMEQALELGLLIVE